MTSKGCQELIMIDKTCNYLYQTWHDDCESVAYRTGGWWSALMISCTIAQTMRNAHSRSNMFYFRQSFPPAPRLWDAHQRYSSWRTYRSYPAIRTAPVSLHSMPLSSVWIFQVMTYLSRYYVGWISSKHHQSSHICQINSLHVARHLALFWKYINQSNIRR